MCIGIAKKWESICRIKDCAFDWVRREELWCWEEGVELQRRALECERSMCDQGVVVGICSIEQVGSFSGTTSSNKAKRDEQRGDLRS